MKNSKKIWIIVLVVIIIIVGIYYFKNKTGNVLASDCFKQIPLNIDGATKNKDICYVKGGGKICGGSYDCTKKEVCGFLLTSKSAKDVEGSEGQVVLADKISGQCFTPTKSGPFADVTENQATLNYLYIK